MSSEYITTSHVEIDGIITRCMEIIEEKKYSRHRFVLNLDVDLPCKKRLGDWALQKYHQVYRQNLIFSIIHAKTQLEDVRQFMMKQLVAEETIINCGTDSHYNLMRRFAQICGVPDDAFVEQTASKEVIDYVDKLLTIVRREHFVIGLLVIYAIEAQSGESVGRLLAALRRNYNFTEEHLEWFTVHSSADDDHADEGLRLVRKYCVLCPEYENHATAIVGEICDAWLQLHDAYASILMPLRTTIA